MFLIKEKNMTSEEFEQLEFQYAEAITKAEQVYRDTEGDLSRAIIAAIEAYEKAGKPIIIGNRIAKMPELKPDAVVFVENEQIREMTVETIFFPEPESMFQHLHKMPKAKCNTRVTRPRSAFRQEAKGKCNSHDQEQMSTAGWFEPIAICTLS